MPRRFGLIGAGISASGSPALFRAAYGGRWSYDLIDEPAFEPAWRRFLAGYHAVNITAPYKEDAFAQAVGLARDGLGSVSGPCMKIGASNLAVKTPEGISFHNSDFSGIILSVGEALFPGIVRACYAHFGERGHIKVHQWVRDNLASLYGCQPQALVVGCGGAGRAAAVAAAEMGFGVALTNRTFDKARDLAAALPEYGFIPVPLSGFPEAFAECDLVIYTLPVGPQEAGLTLPADLSPASPRKLVFEAGYKSPSLAEVPGCQYISGRSWLLYQALSGYGLMTGEQPDFEAMSHL